MKLFFPFFSEKITLPGRDDLVVSRGEGDKAEVGQVEGAGNRPVLSSIGVDHIHMRHKWTRHARSVHLAAMMLCVSHHFKILNEYNKYLKDDRKSWLSPSIHGNKEYAYSLDLPGRVVKCD